MKKYISLFAVVILAMLFMAGGTLPAMAESSTEEVVIPDEAAVLSIKHSAVSGDVFFGGSMDDSFKIFQVWDACGQQIKFVEDANGAYIRMGKQDGPMTGFRFHPEGYVAGATGKTIPAGTYKFTAYVRTALEGHVSMIRFWFHENVDGKRVQLPQVCVNISNEWTKVEFYVQLNGELDHILVSGGPHTNYIQPYCLDEISMVPTNTADESLTCSTAINKVLTFGSNVSAEAAKASSPDLFIPTKMWDAEEEAQYTVQGIMLNQDSTSFYNMDGSNMSDKSIRDFVKELEGTHITDYILNVNCQWSTYPSEVLDDADSMYWRSRRLGVDPHTFFKVYYNHFTLQKLDYFAILLDEFKNTTDINGWISIRPNDSHNIRYIGVDDSYKPTIPDYYYDHPEHWRVRYDSKVWTFYGHALDWTFEEVRNRIFNYTNEALDRYSENLYGIEIDFTRESWLFYPGGEYKGLEIITEFMRDIKTLVDSYNPNLKIGVRIPGDLQTCYDFSLDIMTWVSEGLVDTVVPFAGNDQTWIDMPVRMWASLLEPYGVEFAPSINCNAATNWRWSNMTLRNLFGVCASWMSQGAHKIYTFNYMFEADNRWDASDKVADFTVTDDAITRNSPGKWLFYTTAGSYEKLMKVNRKVLITYNDKQPMWVGDKKANLFPFTLSAGEGRVLRVHAGDVPEGAKVYFKFSSSNGSAETVPTVFINSAEAEFIRSEGHTDNRTSYRILVYEVPVSAYDDGYIVAEIKANALTAIDYAELYIEVVEE